jgi:hypothetical protein
MKVKSGSQVSPHVVSRLVTLFRAGILHLIGNILFACVSLNSCILQQTVFCSCASRMRSDIYQIYGEDGNRILGTMFFFFIIPVGL